MDTNSHNAHPAFNAEVGYDHSDLSVRGIIIFLVGVGIAGVLAQIVIYGMFVGAKRFAPYAAANPMAVQEPISPAPPLQNAGPQSVANFPEPRLQTDDTADMSKFLLREQMELHPSKPYRAPDGTIHISINDAMAIIAQRGLPTRQVAQENAAQTNATGKQNAPKPAGAKPTGGSPGAH